MTAIKPWTEFALQRKANRLHPLVTNINWGENLLPFSYSEKLAVQCDDPSIGRHSQWPMALTFFEPCRLIADCMGELQHGFCLSELVWKKASNPSVNWSDSISRKGFYIVSSIVSSCWVIFKLHVDALLFKCFLLLSNLQASCCSSSQALGLLSSFLTSKHPNISKGINNQHKQRSTRAFSSSLALRGSLSSDGRICVEKSLCILCIAPQPDKAVPAPKLLRF